MQHPTTLGKYFLPGLCLILGIIAADQYTKWLAINFFEGDVPQSVTLAPFLNLVMVWNKGVSFGLFSDGADYVAYILTGVALLAALLMLIWLAVADSRAVAVSLAMIAGGAIGNAIDRVRFGAVADFVDVHAAGLHWPAFNLADSCITLGAIVLMLTTFTGDKGKTR